MEQRRFHFWAGIFVRGMKAFLFWAAMGAFLLPRPLVADVRVAVDRIWTADAGGAIKGQFLPGEVVQYGVSFRVLDLTSGSFSVRLRIMGDGWFETLEKTVVGPGFHQVMWGEDASLRTSSDACEGKVAIHLDIGWADPERQERIEIQGKRHAYFLISCAAGGFPQRLIGHVQVGESPYDMALTADSRFLYVTCKEGRRIFVVRTDAPFEVVAQISDPDKIGEPTGITLAANRTDMLVADYTLQKIHILDTITHQLKDSKSIEGDFGRVKMGDLVLNPLRNELYVCDFAGSRILAINGQNFSPEVFPLSFPDPSGDFFGLNPFKILVDPQGSHLFALCLALGELMKVDLSQPNTWPVVAAAKGLAIPSSSMVFGADRQDLYVVTGEDIKPLESGTWSSIRILDIGNLLLKRTYYFGPYVWDLIIRPDRRFAYGIDSFRGQLVIVDLETGKELRSCAVEVGYGGRLLLADPRNNRIFIGAWSPGAVEIVE